MVRRVLPAPNTDLGLLVLRLAVAAVVLFHGIFKLKYGIAWMEGPLSAFGLPLFVGYGVFLAELLAPVLLTVGAWARLAALVIMFDMMMAVVLVLRDKVFAINPAGGGWAIELEALICLGALTVFLAGPGKYRLGSP